MGSMIDPIIESLRALFSDRLAIEVSSPDTDLIENGLLDSLRLVELLLEIEAGMGHRIPLEEIELDDLRTVGRIARLLAERMESVA
jgi:acyl carrier protein